MHHILALVLLVTLVPSAGATASGASQAVARASFQVTFFDVSRPLRDLARDVTASTVEDRRSPPDAVPFDVSSPSDPDGARQATIGAVTMPVVTGFDSNQGSNVTPPSPSFDVGPAHVLVASNLDFRVHDRSGATVLGPLPNNTLWSGFGGQCQNENAGNPQVMYDHLADRWLMVQATGLGPSYSLCLALSTTGDPTGTWYRWSLGMGTRFPDSPRIALWPDAYYLSTREFEGGTFAGVGAFALDRSAMIAGDPTLFGYGFFVSATAQNLPYIGDGLQPADLDGSRLPPAGAAAYFVGSMDQGAAFGAAQDALSVWRFHVDFASPGDASFMIAPTAPVAAFDSIFPCTGVRGCIPQPGTTTKLDVQSYRQRLLPRVTYRRFDDHEAVFANQSVEAAVGVAGVRWYELRPSENGGLAVHQQGTYAPGDGVHRWNGAIASDHEGNLAMAYSVSSAAVYPGIRATGRLAGDPLGQMTQGEGVLQNGAGSQTSTTSRWGDWSSMVVDPVDDCTFWNVNQYYPVTSSTGWRLRVSSFKYPECQPAVTVEDDDGVDPTALAPIGLTRGPVTVRFALAGATRGVRLDVVDTAGRVVRRLLDETLSAGTHRLTWDRRSDAGQALPPGIYRVVLRTGGLLDSKVVVLLR